MPAFPGAGDCSDSATVTLERSLAGGPYVVAARLMARKGSVFSAVVDFGTGEWDVRASATTRQCPGFALGSSLIHVSIADTVIVPPPPPPPPPPAVVLDDFNRTSLVDATHAWSVKGVAAISSGSLSVSNDATMLWPTVLGPSQEVSARVVNASWPSQFLLFLKAQSLTTATPYLDIFYSNGTITIETFNGAGTWAVRGSIARPLVAGDVLGARASAAGVVDVLVNGVRVGGATITGWPQYALGGRIGCGWYGNSAFRVDDFGGGSAP